MTEKLSSEEQLDLVTEYYLLFNDEITKEQQKESLQIMAIDMLFQEELKNDRILRNAENIGIVEIMGEPFSDFVYDYIKAKKRIIDPEVEEYLERSEHHQDFSSWFFVISQKYYVSITELKNSEYFIVDAYKKNEDGRWTYAGQTSNSSSWAEVMSLVKEHIKNALADEEANGNSINE